MLINGEVKPAFEPVRQLFQQSLTASRDKNAQLCIYLGEERVVDLWATSGADEFSADSLVNVFSSGKSLESILMAMLLIKDYWISPSLYPRIGQNLLVQVKTR